MYAVVRVRGSVGVSSDVEDTLKMLRLKSVNHCVVIPETKEYLGMLNKARNRITWGKIDKKTLVKLLEKRGKIDKETLEKFGLKDFDELATALIEGKIKLKDLKPKLVFRLNPPKHGYKTIRLPFPKGDLGNRGERINELLERMI
jgi:large subunit ribosomal protein L30